jgi:hypothetical protein
VFLAFRPQIDDLKMLLGLEGAHAFYVSIFGGVEHLLAEVRRRPRNWATPLHVAEVPIAER